jgi:hypothetical protein
MRLLELFQKIRYEKVMKYNPAQFFSLQRSSLVLKSSSIGCGVDQTVCSRSVAHFFY